MVAEDSAATPSLKKAHDFDIEVPERRSGFRLRGVTLTSAPRMLRAGLSVRSGLDQAIGRRARRGKNTVQAKRALEQHGSSG